MGLRAAKLPWSSHLEVFFDQKGVRPPSEAEQIRIGPNASGEGRSPAEREVLGLLSEAQGFTGGRNLTYHELLAVISLRHGLSGRGLAPFVNAMASLSKPTNESRRILWPQFSGSLHTAVHENALVNAVRELRSGGPLETSELRQRIGFGSIKPDSAKTATLAALGFLTARGMIVPYKDSFSRKTWWAYREREGEGKLPLTPWFKDAAPYKILNFLRANPNSNLRQLKACLGISKNRIRSSGLDGLLFRLNNSGLVLASASKRLSMKTFSLAGGVADAVEQVESGVIPKDFYARLLETLERSESKNILPAKKTRLLRRLSFTADVLSLREQKNLGARRIARELGVTPSSVASILNYGFRPWLGGKASNLDNVFRLLSKPQQDVLLRDLHRNLASGIEAAATEKVDQEFEELVKDAGVNALLKHDPPVLKAVLRNNVARGIIEKGDAATAKMLLAKAIVSSSLAQKLLENNPRFLNPFRATRGFESVNAALQQELRNYEDGLSRDPVFRTYLRRLAGGLYSKAGGELKLDTPLMRQALIDHAATEYLMLREVPLSTSVIEHSGHRFNAFWFQELYAAVEKKFGSTRETRPVIRTAAERIAQGQYDDVDSAFTAYTEALKEAIRTLGGRKETKRVVRSAALLVFRGTYSSVKDFKDAYERNWDAAQPIFNKYRLGVTRVATLKTTQRIYASLSDAKAEFEKAYGHAKPELEELFGVGASTDILVVAVARSVLERNFSDADAALDRVRKLSIDAESVFGAGEENKKVRMSAIRAVLLGSVSSIERAKEFTSKNSRK